MEPIRPLSSSSNPPPPVARPPSAASLQGGNVPPGGSSHQSVGAGGGSGQGGYYSNQPTSIRHSPYLPPPSPYQHHLGPGTSGNSSSNGNGAPQTQQRPMYAYPNQQHHQHHQQQQYGHLGPPPVPPPNQVQSQSPVPPSQPPPPQAASSAYAPYPYPLPNPHHFQPYQPYHAPPPVPQMNHQYGHLGPPPPPGFSPYHHHLAHQQHPSQPPSHLPQPQLYRPPTVPSPTVAPAAAPTSSAGGSNNVASNATNANGRQHYSGSSGNGGAADASASAAAAALVGLPQPNNLGPPPPTHNQHGGYNSFGLPIPPAHLYQPQQHHHPAYHPQLPPPPPYYHQQYYHPHHAQPPPPPQPQPQHQAQHYHHHPHQPMNPMQSLPPQPASLGLPPPPPLPLHQPSSHAPVGSSSTKPSTPSSTMTNKQKKSVATSKKKEKKPEPVIEPPVTRQRGNRARPRTSYKPLYDSDFEEIDSDDDDDNDDVNDRGRRGTRDEDPDSDVYKEDEDEEDEDEQGRVGRTRDEEGGAIEPPLGKSSVTTNHMKGTKRARDESFEPEDFEGTGGGGRDFNPLMMNSELELPRAEPIERVEQEDDYSDNEYEKKKPTSRGGWGGGAGIGSGTRPETFLKKLWKLLHHDPVDVTEYIAWDNTGRLLIIPDEKKLVEKVCRVHFTQRGITSFNKQMNNWDFKRHSRSQRDLIQLQKHNPEITRDHRIWYHTSLHSKSTWADVAEVNRHEDGMAKKRRVRSKKTGVEEGAAPRKGRPKGSGGAIKLPGDSDSEEGAEELERELHRSLADESTYDNPPGAKKRKMISTTSATAIPKKRVTAKKEDPVQPKPKKAHAVANATASISYFPYGSNAPSPAPSATAASPSPFATGSKESAAVPSDDSAQGKDKEANMDNFDAPGETDDAYPSDQDENSRNPGEDELTTAQVVEGEGDLDAEGVADDEDAEMQNQSISADVEQPEDGDETEVLSRAGSNVKSPARRSPAKKQATPARPPPPPTPTGRRTRTSLGTRNTDPPPSTSKKNTRNRGAKKANAGLDKLGDEIIPEKEGAFDASSEDQTAENRADEELGSSSPAPAPVSATTAAGEQAPMMEAIEIVRQEAPKPKSRGGGWYLPARVAEARRKEQEREEAEQKQASESMQRGGLGLSQAAASSLDNPSLSVIYALPRPPHLSNVAEPSAPTEGIRSTSQPPLEETGSPVDIDSGHERTLHEAAGEQAGELVPPDSSRRGTNEEQQSILHNPVPATSKAAGEEDKTDRDAPEDFEAQYAQLEAFVAGDEGDSHARGGATSEGDDEEMHLYPEHD
ncbi:uncharacterized protein JCM15063_005506 [Sporobolomyces koalae]|uniref:uncharacterized protein n=1 Tax=Sporobolomyces koalae TaxID=500713 RepID=UPI0031803F1B